MSVASASAHRPVRVAQRREIEQAGAQEQVRGRAERRDRAAGRQALPLAPRPGGCSGRTASAGRAARTGRRRPCSSSPTGTGGARWRSRRGSRKGGSGDSSRGAPPAGRPPPRAGRRSRSPQSAARSRSCRRLATVPALDQRLALAIAALGGIEQRCRRAAVHHHLAGDGARAAPSRFGEQRVGRLRHAPSRRPPRSWCRCAAARPGRSSRCARHGRGLRTSAPRRRCTSAASRAAGCRGSRSPGSAAGGCGGSISPGRIRWPAWSSTGVPSGSLFSIGAASPSAAMRPSSTSTMPSSR